MEMVCQRLGQEFQLVEGEEFDPEPYYHYVLSAGKSGIEGFVFFSMLLASYFLF
jgi:hypothetical protein